MSIFPNPSQLHKLCIHEPSPSTVKFLNDAFSPNLSQAHQLQMQPERQYKDISRNLGLAERVRINTNEERHVNHKAKRERDETMCFDPPSRNNISQDGEGDVVKV